MRHNYSPSARGAKINQLDWVSLTKKFDQRQPNVTIPDFIESEITPILGFRMGESTFSKRVIAFRKVISEQVGVIDLEETNTAVMSTSSNKAELLIRIGDASTIVIPSDNPELSAVKILHYLQNKELINA
ncbi:MAG: hypothetical protein SPK55_02270 [Succinivibrio sp.]|nr:hypothetical protein [Succinivibrio sp.]